MTLTFADLDTFLNHLEQVARDTRRAAVTDLLLSDRYDGHEDDLADRLDRDRERYDAEMQQWRVAARRQLAALPLTFPLHVDWTTCKPPALSLDSSRQRSRIWPRRLA